MGEDSDCVCRHPNPPLSARLYIHAPRCVVVSLFSTTAVPGSSP